MKKNFNRTVAEYNDNLNKGKYTTMMELLSKLTL